MTAEVALLEHSDDENADGKEVHHNVTVGGPDEDDDVKEDLDDCIPQCRRHIEKKNDRDGPGLHCYWCFLEEEDVDFRYRHCCCRDGIHRGDAHPFDLIHLARLPAWHQEEHHFEKEDHHHHHHDDVVVDTHEDRNTPVLVSNEAEEDPDFHYQEDTGDVEGTEYDEVEVVDLDYYFLHSDSCLQLLLPHLVDPRKRMKDDEDGCYCYCRQPLHFDAKIWRPLQQRPQPPMGLLETWDVVVGAVAVAMESN
jgi:hypothetical protein